MTGYSEVNAFEKIDKSYLSDIKAVFESLAEIQNKHQHINDTFINDYQDSIVALACGFDSINTAKHGMDAWRSDSGDFLEVKCSSTQKPTAVFNDTTLQKIDFLSNQNVYLALAQWGNLGSLERIIYGKTNVLCDYLKERVKSQTINNQRRTQSISGNTLLKKYGYIEILPKDFKS